MKTCVGRLSGFASVRPGPAPSPTAPSARKSATNTVVARGLYAWLTHPLHVSVFGNFGPQYIRPPKARMKPGCRGQSHARERNVLQTDPESIPLVMVQTYDSHQLSVCSAVLLQHHNSRWLRPRRSNIRSSTRRSVSCSSAIFHPLTSAVVQSRTERPLSQR